MWKSKMGLLMQNIVDSYRFLSDFSKICVFTGIYTDFIVDKLSSEEPQLK